MTLKESVGVFVFGLPVSLYVAYVVGYIRGVRRMARVSEKIIRGDKGKYQ